MKNINLLSKVKCVTSNQKFKMAMIGSFLFLSSCDGFGPFHISLKANQNATLISKKGEQFVLAAGQTYQGVRIEGKSKKIVISLGAQKAIFEGADYSQDDSSASCNPSASNVHTDSGEAVGLTVSRQLAHSEKEVFQENRQCQINEQHCYPVCHGPNGHNCHQECVIYSRPGRELVEREELRLTYAYLGQLLTQNNTQGIASFDGHDVEVHVRERVIFPCH